MMTSFNCIFLPVFSPKKIIFNFCWWNFLFPSHLQNYYCNISLHFSTRVVFVWTFIRKKSHYWIIKIRLFFQTFVLIWKKNVFKSWFTFQNNFSWYVRLFFFFTSNKSRQCLNSFFTRRSTLEIYAKYLLNNFLVSLLLAVRSIYKQQMRKEFFFRVT